MDDLFSKISDLIEKQKKELEQLILGELKGKRVCQVMDGNRMYLGKISRVRFAGYNSIGDPIFEFYLGSSFSDSTVEQIYTRTNLKDIEIIENEN